MTAAIRTLPPPRAASAAAATPPGAVPSAASPASRVRVMICDDSATIRNAIGRILASDPEIEVLAKVSNGRMAIEELGRRRCDVIILDIEMPVLDGMAALPLLLRADPGVKVIMASTLTTRGADIALRALRLGASDYVPKPSSLGTVGDDAFRREILQKVKGLASLRRRVSLKMPPRALPPLRPGPVCRPALLAIGSSTGGPQALFTLIQGLGRPLDLPIVLTQHMPPSFTAMLADHLTRLGIMPCHEARDGDGLVPGHLHLAPGDRHMLVEGSIGRLRVRLTSDPPENFCRPSVDPMLRSAAAACEGRVLVTMLTGMGHDGLAGTRTVIEAGGAAIAQDEATSIVWGMPGAIAQAGLCHDILPLPDIAPKLLDILKGARP